MKFLLIQMLLLLVLTPINSEAKMYKCIDEKGKVSFTDKMCPSDSSKEEIQTKNKRAHSQPINKDGITILDWTNRRSGSGVYYYVEGILKNTSDTAVTRVKVKIRSLDYNGHLVSLDDGYADPSSLNPGQEATFQVMVRNSQQIKNFSLNVSWK